MADNLLNGSLRWIAGGVVILLALGALTWVFFALISGKDVEPLTAFGAFAGPIVTVVSAYFGIQASASAAKEATNVARQAVESAEALSTSALRMLNNQGAGPAGDGR